MSLPGEQLVDVLAVPVVSGGRRHVLSGDHGRTAGLPGW